MTNRSTTGSTELPTDPAMRDLLVSVFLETRGVHHRLRAYGAPLRGVRRLHEWRFTATTLSGPLLNEIGATVDSLTLNAVLMASGIQGELALALLDPPEEP